jgi:hypothetical protein
VLHEGTQTERKIGIAGKRATKGLKEERGRWQRWIKKVRRNGARGRLGCMATSRETYVGDDLLAHRDFQKIRIAEERVEER